MRNIPATLPPPPVFIAPSMTTNLPVALMNPFPNSLSRSAAGRLAGQPRLAPNRLRTPALESPEPSSTLALARRAAREVTRSNRIDSTALLFLAASAAVVAAGCAVRVEQFLAGWSSFESFVRALLA
jgi:hypothetical protein